ncbi:hypothetical protein T11_1624 [Trichinella zimbabwensis]|uniref:Uncharacterized protein n=1 Tax=Trichinella zimbabwensis TaxID=268475 RepID=A0A0V1GAA7_9BILA|nr:hypothetical protein T11_1624 [Trichinella zimbabwensis]
MFTYVDRYPYKSVKLADPMRNSHDMKLNTSYP